MAAVDLTALGLPLDTSDDDYDIVQPLEVMAVVKGLDSRGEVCHWAIKTPDLTNVEAWGMAMFGAKVASES
jgi:hypothetical protein